MDKNSEIIQSYVDKDGQYISQENGVEISMDTNADGVIDCVLHTSAGGHTVWLNDTDFDGKMDTVTDCGGAWSNNIDSYVDSDADGAFDVLFLDNDDVCGWDTIMEDRDGDGVFESPVADFNN